MAVDEEMEEDPTRWSQDEWDSWRAENQVSWPSQTGWSNMKAIRSGWAALCIGHGAAGRRQSAPPSAQGLRSRSLRKKCLRPLAPPDHHIPQMSQQP